MFAFHSSTTCRDTAPASVRGFIRCDGPAVLLVAAATLAAGLGAYAVGLGLGATRLGAALASIAALTLWNALAPAPLAAAPHSAWSGALRGFTVCDASLVTLLILTATGSGLSVIAALKIYCVFASMATVGTFAARVPGRCAMRQATAVLAAVALMVLLASPFWSGGLLAKAEGAAKIRAARALVYWNPFYSATAPGIGEARVIWHQLPGLYERTRIGDYAPAPPLRWHAAPLRLGIAGGVLGIAWLLAASRRRRSTVA